MTLFLCLLAGFLVLFPGAAGGQEQAKPKPQPKVIQQEQQEPYTEEEYDAMMAATKEADLDKKAQMLQAFKEKYPKSTLMSYIDQAFQSLKYEYSKNQKWDKLIPLAEEYLKAHANDLQSMAYIAEASKNLGQDQKFIEYAEKIYQEKPSSELAYAISQSYNKLGNEPKYLEWTEKLFSFPEYDGQFALRWIFVEKYTKEKKFDKAAQYAQLALKSLDVAKKPDGTPDAKWKEETTAVRRGCYFTIGLNYYEREKWDQAIKSLQQSVKVERFAAGYYYIGLCQWRLDQVEEAILSFAKAVTLKGEVAPQAKERLEKLYKALHNNTTIGIEKVYQKAEKELGMSPSKD